MQLKNNLVNMLQGIFLPIKQNKDAFIKLKDTFFASSSEHLYRLLLHVDANKEGIIIDVGAANGDTAIFFKKNLKKAKVFAIEPNPKMWTIIEQSIQGNDRVELKKMALGENKGHQILHVTANNWSSSLKQLNVSEVNELPVGLKNHLQESTRVEVEVSTLDDEFSDHERILILKLDTQGNELSILKGGISALKKTRFVITELNNNNIYKDCDQYFEVDEFLRLHNFKLLDMVVSYRTNHKVLEYDAIYENIDLC